jgi:GTPase SAR1 family protein
MNIVIFGPDNSGKTTLANQIKDLGFQYVRSLGAGKTSQEYLDYLDITLNNAKKTKSNLIFDRFSVIEESVNGPILRNVDLMDTNFIDVNRFLSRIDLFIFCMPPKSVITNWGDREQMAGIKENIDKLIDKYLDYSHKLYEKKMNIIHYDWTCDKQEEVFGIIKAIDLLKRYGVL